MQVLNKNDTIPENATRVEYTEKGINVYFESDKEEIVRVLNVIKLMKKEEIRNEYTKELKKPFLSNGEKYSSDAEDIQDLISAVTINTTVEFKPKDSTFKQYTSGQIKQVLSDCHTNKIVIIKKRDTLFDDIDEATTKEYVSVITW